MQLCAVSSRALTHKDDVLHGSLMSVGQKVCFAGPFETGRSLSSGKEAADELAANIKQAEHAMQCKGTVRAKDSASQRQTPVVLKISAFRHMPLSSWCKPQHAQYQGILTACSSSDCEIYLHAMR